MENIISNTAADFSHDPLLESKMPERNVPLVYRSDELLQGRREVWIEHPSGYYRLRITSAGKLYLTK